MIKSITLFIGVITLSTATMADSLWNHNGSVMRLEANGNQRVMVYEKPSAKMAKAGVTKGTVLFSGVRQGNKYYGESRMFSKDCSAPLSYSVSGNVVNERTIVLKGQREVYAKGCVPTSKMVTDTLKFTYISGK